MDSEKRLLVITLRIRHEATLRRRKVIHSLWKMNRRTLKKLTKTAFFDKNTQKKVVGITFLSYLFAGIKIKCLSLC